MKTIFRFFYRWKFIIYQLHFSSFLSFSLHTSCKYRFMRSMRFHFNFIANDCLHFRNIFILVRFVWVMLWHHSYYSRSTHFSRMLSYKKLISNNSHIICQLNFYCLWILLCILACRFLVFSSDLMSDFPPLFDSLRLIALTISFHFHIYSAIWHQQALLANFSPKQFYYILKILLLTVHWFAGWWQVNHH